MEHNLSMRLTVIGGETAEGDYSVFREERIVGRIRATEDHVHNTQVWSWSITVPLPLAAWCHGSAESLEAAKWAFRSAWDRFYSDLTSDEIARWHYVQDEAARLLNKFSE